MSSRASHLNCVLYCIQGEFEQIITKFRGGIGQLHDDDI